MYADPENLEGRPESKTFTQIELFIVFRDAESEEIIWRNKLRKLRENREASPELIAKVVRKAISRAMASLPDR